MWIFHTKPIFTVVSMVIDKPWMINRVLSICHLYILYISCIPFLLFMIQKVHLNTLSTKIKLLFVLFFVIYIWWGRTRFIFWMYAFKWICCQKRLHGLEQTFWKKDFPQICPKLYNNNSKWHIAFAWRNKFVFFSFSKYIYRGQ